MRTRSLRLDLEGRIDEGLRCYHCEYELRGLLPTAECPECGEPIAESTHSELLRHADSTWVLNLARGAAYVFWGGLLSNMRMRWGSPNATLEVGSLVVTWFVPAVVALVGWWLLTRPEPDRLASEVEKRQRMLLRLLACAAFVINGWEAVFFSQHLDDPLPPSVSITIDAAYLYLQIFLVGGFARYLAKRLSDKRLGKQVQIVQWLLGVSYALIGAFSIVQLVLSGPMTQPASRQETWSVSGIRTTIESPLAYAALPAVIAMLVAFIWSFVLIGHYKSALRTAATEPAIR